MVLIISEAPVFTATDTTTDFASGVGEFSVDLKVGSEGDLFFLARATDSVEKISYTLPPPT